MFRQRLVPLLGALACLTLVSGCKPIAFSSSLGDAVAGSPAGRSSAGATGERAGSPATTLGGEAAVAAPTTSAGAVPSAEAAPSSTAEASSAVPPPPAAVVPAASGAAVPARVTDGVLSWAPPAGWPSYPVRTVTATDSLTVVDGKGGDIRIELDPTHPVGPITIRNCRNAVLIGGQITVLPSAQVGGADQRAIYVQKCTGTVHIEGVRIDGDVAGSQSDGIAVNAPQAVLQIQNVRVDGLRGGLSGNHADVFQPWGGIREFRIDRLTGSSNYQGLHIFEVLGQIGGGTVRNTNLASSGVLPVDGGGYFIWTDCADGFPLTLDEVYVAGRQGRSLGASVWPTPRDAECPADISDGVATWPGNPSLTGEVREGRPPAGDFVPVGSAGLGYASPGYR